MNTTEFEVNGEKRIFCPYCEKWVEFWKNDSDYFCRECEELIRSEK
jgi:predicted amidophosphoribosyltransferase